MARSKADLTAVLEAIVLLEVVLVLSESLLWREAGVTAVLASVPVWVSAFVASSTSPEVVEVAAEPAKPTDRRSQIVPFESTQSPALNVVAEPPGGVKVPGVTTMAK